LIGRQNKVRGITRKKEKIRKKIKENSENEIT
jgi:hypothetical protein